MHFFSEINKNKSKKHLFLLTLLGMLILIIIKSKLQPKSLTPMAENNIYPEVLTSVKEFVMCCLKATSRLKYVKKKIELYFLSAIYFSKVVELNGLTESLWLPRSYKFIYSMYMILLAAI